MYDVCIYVLCIIYTQKHKYYVTLLLLDFGFYGKY